MYIWWSFCLFAIYAAIFLLILFCFMYFVFVVFSRCGRKYVIFQMWSWIYLLSIWKWIYRWTHEKVFYSFLLIEFCDFWILLFFLNEMIEYFSIINFSQKNRFDIKGSIYKLPISSNISSVHSSSSSSHLPIIASQPNHPISQVFLSFLWTWFLVGDWKCDFLDE